MWLLLARIVCLALGSFFLKVVIKHVDPFIASTAIGVALLAIAGPFVVVRYPFKHSPWWVWLLTAFVGVMFAAGYVIMALALRTQGVGFVETFSHAYIPAVVVASWLILGEEMSWQRAVGTALVVGGVILVAW